MHESGATTLRSKKKSSISIATGLVKSGDADAVISAGNTGAAVANATLKLRTIKGIERAGICSPLPNEYGTCNLLDAGANPDAKPEHLVGYAIMGAVYAKEVLGVALVESGNAPFTFRGNIEGKDVFETQLDVCLCEGFLGNVVLKTVESTAKAMSKWLKLELTRKPHRVLGAAMAKGAFKDLKGRTNYESYGGSPLLGVNGVCIIAHGGSSSLAIKNAIRVACDTVGKSVNPQIEAALKAANLH